MEKINDKLHALSGRLSTGAPLKIAIFGIGSVACYLLDYLASWSEQNIQIHLCSRSPEKTASDMNIVRVANLIRQNVAKPMSLHRVDLNNTDEIASVLQMVSPDFIVNCSRAYSHLKYGSISWKNIRAYGLWCPLSVKLIRNIMLAYQQVGASAIVINTSYADVVNKWLKSAGMTFPDFGSGNLNHLIPRIKLAVAAMIGGIDASDVEVVLATGHFHDVLISNEGHTEGVSPLVHLSVKGRPVEVNLDEMYKRCAIPMPSDSKRNMMNASSNLEIISKIVEAVRMQSRQIIHIPGVAGYLGGYPVLINFRNEMTSDKPISFFEDYFSIQEMESHNRLSMGLDGIEDISEGTVTFTPVLREKVKNRFQVDMPKAVTLEGVDEMAEFLIGKIIQPSLRKVQ